MQDDLTPNQRAELAESEALKTHWLHHGRKLPTYTPGTRASGSPPLSKIATVGPLKTGFRHSSFGWWDQVQISKCEHIKKRPTRSKRQSRQD